MMDAMGVEFVLSTVNALISSRAGFVDIFCAPERIFGDSLHSPSLDRQPYLFALGDRGKIFEIRNAHALMILDFLLFRQG
jgi:hypothetical protein